MGGHTPGPWAIDDDDEATVLIDYAPGVLAQAYAGTAANAALIAAAPDLLEALKDIATQKLTTERDEQGDIEFGYDAIIKVARAAVAKAEARDA